MRELFRCRKNFDDYWQVLGSLKTLRRLQVQFPVDSDYYESREFDDFLKEERWRVLGKEWLESPRRCLRRLEILIVYLPIELSWLEELLELDRRKCYFIVHDKEGRIGNSSIREAQAHWYRLDSM